MNYIFIRYELLMKQSQDQKQDIKAGEAKGAGGVLVWVWLINCILIKMLDINLS